MTNTPDFPAPDPQDRMKTISSSAAPQATPAQSTRRRRGAMIVAAAALCGALLGGVAIVMTDRTESTPADDALDDVTPREESAVDDADIGAQIDRELEEESARADQQFADWLDEEQARQDWEDLEEQLEDARRAAEKANEEEAKQATPATSLEQICLTLHHFLAGETYPTVWRLRGTVAGAPEGTQVVVHGATINDGQPVAADVVGGSFETTLGVSAYGDHVVSGIDAVGPTDEVTSLLDDALQVSAISDGEHIILPVGPDEGAVLGEECFEVASVLQQPDYGEVEAVQAFLDRLVELHANGDSGTLAELLDQRVVDAFGERACIDQLVATTGSLLELRVVSIDGRGSFTLDTSVGPIEFDDAVTVTVDMVTTAGEHRQQINLPIHHDFGWTWITHCD